MDDPLTTLKVRDLRKLASTYNLRGRSKRTRKEDLVDFLREHLTVDQIEKGVAGKKTPSPKSETELFDLPIELIWETLYDLPPKDVLHFCKTHWKAKEKICQNDDFWFGKIQRDFGELFDTSSIPTKNRLETYKLFWKEAQEKFISCARKGHFKCVQSLLQLGINPDIQDKTGWTALMSASWMGHMHIVLLLLDHGAKPDIQSRNDGWTALMRASLRGHRDIIQLLLDRGANSDIQGHYGQTAHTFAARFGYKLLKSNRR